MSSIFYYYRVFYSFICVLCYKILIIINSICYIYGYVLLDVSRDTCIVGWIENKIKNKIKLNIAYEKCVH